MKKILSLVLAIIMLVGLCSCLRDNENDNVRGDIVTQTSSESENEPESEPEFSLGKTANNVYNNDFLGLSCTLSDEWTFYTDEEILQLNNLTAELVDEEIAQSLENANIIYDMYAVQADGSNININLEKLNALQLISLDIKETLESQIDTIKTAFEGIGYTDINAKYQKVTVDGKEFDALVYDAKIQGIDFYGTVITFRKGNYLANITVSSLQTDKTNEIFSCFTVK